MKPLCVTLIFLAVLLFHPKAAAGRAWLYWLVRALAVLWAVWLQRRIFNADKPNLNP